MTRPWQEVPCIQLSLAGELTVDWRSPLSTSYGAIGLKPIPSEAEIWLEVHKRREPDKAYFIGDRCMHRGAFPTEAAARLKAGTVLTQPPTRRTI